MKGYAVLLFASLIIRLLVFTLDMPFRSDVWTFQIWAHNLFEYGLSEFYYADTFTDYPPMYMYVLWVVGAIRSIFAWEYLSTPFNLLTFAPAITADIITVLLIYKLCRDSFKNVPAASPWPFGFLPGFMLDKNNDFGLAFWFAFLYSANPSILINSSVWGQVDSIHTLLLFIAINAVVKAQTLPVFLLYGVAVLTKPQSLIVAPIFLYAAFHYFKENNYSLKSGLTMLSYGALTFMFMALISLPFGRGFDLSPVIGQYIDTVGSRPFASINAFNFYALTGGNWQPITPFYTLVSVVAIGGVTCMTFWILHKHWSGSSAFLSGALLYTVTFVFSVRMNERYLFPAILFMFLAVILRENKVDKRLSFLYGAFSATFFINCADILLQTYGRRLFTLGTPSDVVFRQIDEAMALISFMHVALAVYLIKIGWDIRQWKSF